MLKTKLLFFCPFFLLLLGTILSISSCGKAKDLPKFKILSSNSRFETIDLANYNYPKEKITSNYYVSINDIVGSNDSISLRTDLEGMIKKSAKVEYSWKENIKILEEIGQPTDLFDRYGDRYSLSQAPGEQTALINITMPSVPSQRQPLGIYPFILTLVASAKDYKTTLIEIDFRINIINYMPDMFFNTNQSITSATQDDDLLSKDFFSSQPVYYVDDNTDESTNDLVNTSYKVEYSYVPSSLKPNQNTEWFKQNFFESVDTGGGYIYALKFNKRNMDVGYYVIHINALFTRTNYKPIQRVIEVCLLVNRNDSMVNPIIVENTNKSVPGNTPADSIQEFTIYNKRSENNFSTTFSLEDDSSIPTDSFSPISGYDTYDAYDYFELTTIPTDSSRSLVRAIPGKTLPNPIVVSKIRFNFKCVSQKGGSPLNDELVYELYLCPVYNADGSDWTTTYTTGQQNPSGTLSYDIYYLPSSPIPPATTPEFTKILTSPAEDSTLLAGKKYYEIGIHYTVSNNYTAFNLIIPEYVQFQNSSGVNYIAHVRAIGDNISGTANNIFTNNDTLKGNITFPTTLAYITISAFKNAKKITGLTIRGRCEISAYAFEDILSLKWIDLSEFDGTIKLKAFNKNYFVKGIYFGSNQALFDNSDQYPEFIYKCFNNVGINGGGFYSEMYMTSRNEFLSFWKSKITTVGVESFANFNDNFVTYNEWFNISIPVTP